MFDWPWLCNILLDPGDLISKPLPLSIAFERCFVVIMGAMDTGSNLKLVDVN